MEELSDLNAGFSEWVHFPPEVNNHWQKVGSSKLTYSDVEFTDAVRCWLENPADQTGIKTLKKMVRRGVQPNLRREFWIGASGGTRIGQNYREIINDMGKKSLE